MACEHPDMTRRRFGTGLGVMVIGGAFGTMTNARGGGGDVRTQQAETAWDQGNQETMQKPRTFTQKEFANLSRSKLFELNRHRNACVDGFSQEMSAHLFDMGLANLPRTNALLKRLQTVRGRRPRQDLLDREVEAARQDLEGFRGFSVQRKKRRIYFDKVSIWAQNPDEGTLDRRDAN